MEKRSLGNDTGEQSATNSGRAFLEEDIHRVELQPQMQLSMYQFKQQETLLILEI